jgi:hypothetical protein
VDSGTRLRFLERLAESRTPNADEAIGRACEQAYAVLAESNEYESLEFSIEVLFTVGFRRSAETVAAISRFVRSVEGRNLVYSSEYNALFPGMSRYRNATSLVSKCIKVLSKLRYLETPDVVETLLWASTHLDAAVRTEATGALSALAKYNLSVFFGSEAGGKRGIGAAPQLSVIGILEKKSIEDLVAQLTGVLTLLEGMLSTAMESTSWSSNEVILTRGVTPADPDVIKVRQASIELLKKLYQHCSSKPQKLAIITSLNAATRSERTGAFDQVYAGMIANSAQEVLSFFAGIVGNEDLQIVQKIEHDSYWIQFHSPSKDVKMVALKVKAAIDANPEYEIYRTLIGFEGVFGDWFASRADESFSIGKQDARKEAARALAHQIEEDGFSVWRERILTFAQTESNDLATFPVFYEFLAEMATSHSSFALSLLVSDSQALSRFLIPILVGVWKSEQRNDLIQLIQGWIKNARPEATNYLYVCAKFFLSTTDVDVKILEQILARAAELKDEHVLRQIASVAVARTDLKKLHHELKRLFLSALSQLTALGDANWVSEIWFRAEAKSMISELSSSEQKQVLNNLRLLPRIDYQAENVLAVIAERNSSEVIDFFCTRLYEPMKVAKELADEDFGSYEELPFELHALQDPLSKDAMMVVQKVLECYRKDPVLFEYRGGKLLQIIFPEFSESFQSALIQIVRDGGDAEYEFIAGVLRAFSGESFLYPVAKELIRRLVPGSSLVSVVALALQNTGVVTGEYGFADAYERKRLEILDWLHDADERVRVFATNYISELERMRDTEKARADEQIVLRKFDYGEE